MKQLSFLIVDDDMSVRELLGSLLRTQFGATVVTTGDTANALRKCREQELDIIWLGIGTSQEGGLETLDMIMKAKPDQCVVMVSVDSSVELVKKSVELGARGFIVKPFSTARVKSTVDEYLASC